MSKSKKMGKREVTCWRETRLVCVGRRGRSYLANNFHDPGAPSQSKRRRILLPRITSQGQLCCDRVRCRLLAPTEPQEQPPPKLCHLHRQHINMSSELEIVSAFVEGAPPGEVSAAVPPRPTMPSLGLTLPSSQMLLPVLPQTNTPDDHTEADLRTRYQVSD